MGDCDLGGIDRGDGRFGETNASRLGHPLAASHRDLRRERGFVIGPRERPILPGRIGSNRRALRDPALVFLGDFDDSFFVDPGVLRADISIDLIPVGVEINIGWPAIDAKHRGGFGVLFGVDTDCEDMFVECGDELLVFECLLL